MMLKLTTDKKRLALYVTVIMTVLATALRLALGLDSQRLGGGSALLPYVVILLFAVAMICMALLLWKDDTVPETLPPVRGRWLMTVSVALIVIGGVIVLMSALDMYRWATTGVTPPPSAVSTGGIDTVTLFLSLILAVLSGIYFIRLGLFWMSADHEMRGLMPLWALAPTLWIWMRLARYELSYVSAVEVHKSFYDFAMLLFMMLFLFTLARHFTGINQKPSKWLIFYALATAMLSLSGALSRVGFFLLGEGDAYTVGQLAGVPDFAVGVLALVMSVYWILFKTRTETLPADTTPAVDADETP